MTYILAKIFCSDNKKLSLLYQGFYCILIYILEARCPNQEKQKNVQVIMEFKLNHRGEIGVQLYLNKNKNNWSIAAYGAKSVKTDGGDGGGGGLTAKVHKVGL